MAFSLLSSFLSSLPLLAARTNFVFKLGAVLVLDSVVCLFFVFGFLVVVMATIGPEDDAFSLRWIADRMSKKGRRRRHGAGGGRFMDDEVEDDDDEGFEQLSAGEEEEEEEVENDEEEETRWDAATASVARRSIRMGYGSTRGGPWRWNTGRDVLGGKGGKYVASTSPQKAQNGISSGATGSPSEGATGGPSRGVSSHRIGRIDGGNRDSQPRQKAIVPTKEFSNHSIERQGNRKEANLAKQNSTTRFADEEASQESSGEF